MSLAVAPFTRRQAMERAARATAYPVGYCARWTREQYGIAPSGDVDGDRDVDAVDAWERATLRHTDRNPPPGVPVYWSGGRSGHGHIAISWPGGMIRSTDAPIVGRVGTVTLAYPEKDWGLRYLGWSEDLNGVLIPVDKPRRPEQIRAALKALRARLAVAGPVEAKRIRTAIAKLLRIKKR